MFAVLFMLIGIIIYGVKHGHGGLHWSYAFSVIGAILCFVASIFAVVQMKQSNVVWADKTALSVPALTVVW